MAKPVLLTVDDDPDVLRAVERDLRRKYSENYRVLRAESGAAALDLLRKLEQRNEPVALLLADHRMPNMNGLEFLAEAMKIYPDACRASLLTAYADTRCGFEIHQRYQAASLPAHAVGSAGRKPLSRRR